MSRPVSVLDTRSETERAGSITMDIKKTSSFSTAANPNKKPTPPPANPGKKPPDSLPSVNPNWAQLQQQIKSRRHRNGEPSVAAQTPSTTALGKRKDRPDSEPDATPPPSPLTPTSTDCSLTDAVAMDCEMVGVSSQGNKSALARVTLVNTWGNVVYDEYVRPLDHIVDFRTNISGIQPKNMKRAKEFMTVQKKVAELIKGRILVGHALHNDLKVLLLSHPKKDTRDTADYQPLLREGRKRALKDLAAEILGVKIQQKEHCPVEDARAVMLIYKKYKQKWERNIKKQLKFKQKLKGKHRKMKPTGDAINPTF